MPCHSGGWLGMDAIAAKAKMWNNEPAGRSRHQATTSEQPPATRVVAATCATGARRREPEGHAGAGGQGGEQDYHQHQRPGRN